jgi:hypothetical protein
MIEVIINFILVVGRRIKKRIRKRENFILNRKLGRINEA